MIRILPALCAGVLASPAAVADEAIQPYPGWSIAGSYLRTTDRGRILAQAPAGMESADTPASIRKPEPADGGKPEPRPWYSRNNMHKYLGLGSITLAGLTLISPKKENSAHEYFARGAAALGVAAVGTGVYAHWDDIDANWRNPDTQHAVLGTLGAVGFLAAVAQGGKGNHAAYGGLGALSMVVAIKLTW